LTALTPGQTGVITVVELPEGERARLLELGLVPGTVVELVRFAPLGDPVELKVRGYHLTLRRHEAEQVRVRAEAKG
jgi:Fe2+ transport system protein FeoA